MIQFNNLQETVKQPKILAVLASVVTSPLFVPVATTITVVGGLFIIFGGKKDKPETDDADSTIESGSEGLLTVQETVLEPLDEPLNTNGLTVNEPFEQTVDEQFTDDEINREMIRRTMSEMGKRSGEARRRRKLGL